MNKWLCVAVFASVLRQQGAAFAAEHRASGITEPVQDAVLSATVAGRVEAIDRREGDLVRKGDVIMRLESELEELEVERRKLIADSKVELLSASNRVATLKLAYDGTRQLYESTQSVSKEEMEKRALEYMLAQAEFDGVLITEEREAIARAGQEFVLEYATYRQRIKTMLNTMEF